MSELPTIEVEGASVAPSRGVYRCPFNCHYKGYPAPTWKTEKGFRKHLETCSCSPLAQQKKAEKASVLQQENAAKAEGAASANGLAIGDDIFYYTYTVTAPTHVQRGNRSVRVRYEELRNYYAAAGKVESFDWNGVLYINGRIPVSHLCENLAIAKEIAFKKAQAYQEHLDFSAAVR